MLPLITPTFNIVSYNRLENIAPGNSAIISVGSFLYRVHRQTVMNSSGSYTYIVIIMIILGTYTTRPEYQL